MTQEEWELHPDRIKTICETAIDYIIELERFAEYYSERTPSDGRFAISNIKELQDLYIKLYNKTKQ